MTLIHHTRITYIHVTSTQAQAVFRLDMPVQTADCGQLFAADGARGGARVYFVVVPQRARRGEHFPTHRAREVLRDGGRRVK